MTYVPTMPADPAAAAYWRSLYDDRTIAAEARAEQRAFRKLWRAFRQTNPREAGRIARMSATEYEQFYGAALASGQPMPEVLHQLWTRLLCARVTLRAAAPKPGRIPRRRFAQPPSGSPNVTANAPALTPPASPETQPTPASEASNVAELAPC